MLIEGPMNITIAEPADGQGKVLVILFTPEFQTLELSEQGEAFRRYLEMLQNHIESGDGVDQRNRAGMVIVQQFAEQLVPHIQGGELALEERIVIQIRQQDQAEALQDLLSPEVQ
jgi:hypothetical protein